VSDKPDIHRIVDKALFMGQVMMENAEKRGDVTAARQDIEANFGVDVPPEAAKALMAMGATLVLVAMGKGLASGAIKLDEEVARKQIAEMKAQLAEESSALRSANDEEDKPITLEAERAAADALARIRKLH